MIPKEIVKYDRPKSALEEWLVFSVLVANKPAKRAARTTGLFLDLLPGGSPLNKIRSNDGRTVRGALRRARTGQYRRILRALQTAAELDPRTATLEELEEAVGPKTARFFILSTRRNARCAALDTHVLKFLRSRGHDVPAVTPAAGPTYRRIEQLFLDEARRRRMSPARLDEAVWRSYAVLKRPYK